MSDTPKAGTPRWLLIATGIAGLVAAVLVAATKYYELHKARAEAEAARAAVPATPPATPPQRVDPKPDANAAPPADSVPKPAAVPAKGGTKPPPKTPATAWEKVFPAGMYEGTHVHNGGAVARAAVDLRPDGSYRRVMNGQHLTEGRFEFRDNKLLLRGGTGVGFIKEWTAVAAGRVEIKLWYPVNLYPGFAPVETGSLRRRE